MYSGKIAVPPGGGGIHVVHNSEFRRARIDQLTFIESADPNYPRLDVFNAVIKKNSKMSGSVITVEFLMSN
jgi:hypothetical protein